MSNKIEQLEQEINKLREQNKFYRKEKDGLQEGVKLMVYLITKNGAIIQEKLHQIAILKGEETPNKIILNETTNFVIYLVDVRIKSLNKQEKRY